MHCLIEITAYMCEAEPRTECFEAEAVSIGRHPMRDLVLEHAQVSRLHAIIRAVGDELVVQDVGSTNGVFVGARRVPSGATMHLGGAARLRIGPVVLDVRLRAGGAPDVARSAIRRRRDGANGSASFAGIARVVDD